MAFKPIAYPGVLHHYTWKLGAFTHLNKVHNGEAPKNHVLFIGGLDEGLLSFPYPQLLAARLPPEWALTSVLLSSSYTGWATSSLAKDATELAACVSYFRGLNPAGKIILMGHSTGCQDCMEYLTGSGSGDRPAIQGVILQAAVSDREALGTVMEPEVLRKSVVLAKEMVAAGLGSDILPASATAHLFGSSCSASRWLSLVSPEHDGDDDYFSSDLTDAQLQNSFGRLPATTPLCILNSERDQNVPGYVDKESLIKKWIGVTKKGGGVVDDLHSGVVPKASHNLAEDSEEVVDELFKRVVGFLSRIDEGGLKTRA